MEYSDLMVLLDSDETISLYRLENDVFDTVVAIVNEGEANEETWVLTDMQGTFPVTIDEMSEYDWARAEDVDW